jgi:zinc D-Ala-D-Ala carboxypeptidase
VQLGIVPTLADRGFAVDDLLPVRPEARVSPHFTFGELTRTDVRPLLEKQLAAPAQIRANLRRLAVDLLEPARALVGPLRVTSGYRSPELNRIIGGSKTSAHMDGLAADVIPMEMDIREAFTTLAQSGLAVDQLIYEQIGSTRWIHIGAPRHATEPRLQRLAMYESGYVRWSPADRRFRGGA